MALNFSSNDYLGLAQDEGIRDQAFQMAAPYPIGATGSRLMSGQHELVALLESELAAFFQMPSALVFGSGYHANLGVLPALTQKGDLILMDKLAHASLIDGARLSPALLRRFSHQDMGHLKQYLERYHGKVNRIWVVTESVFSMDGDQANLAEILALARHYGAKVLVDDAHSVGIMGPQGRGVAAPYVSEIDVLVGTFGKAFGSYGAYVLASSQIRDYLIDRCRSFIYTTGLPSYVLAVSLLALRRLPELDTERGHVAGMAKRLRNGLSDIGQAVLGDTHIVPLLLGDSELTSQVSRWCLDSGIYVCAIRSPTVSEGAARLRLSVTGLLKTADIDQVTTALRGYLKA